MKFTRTRPKVCIATLFLWGLVLLPILAAHDPNKFDPRQLILLVIQGNFQSAAAEADHAIAYYRDLIAADPEKGPYNLVGYYMCAKAQLVALRGDFVGADRLLSEAKTYSSGRPGFSGFLNPWEIIVSEIHAFILEKAGKRDEAAQAYNRPDPYYGQGRLALLALDAGDYTKARQLALAAEQNPTAYFVLGRLEEKDGHKQVAREWYNKAWAELHFLEILLPIYYCDGPAIASAQKRLER